MSETRLLVTASAFMLLVSFGAAILLYAVHASEIWIIFGSTFAGIATYASMWAFAPKADT